MQKVVLTIVLFFVSSFLLSQTIQRSSMQSSAGSYGSFGTLEVQSNIGELMFETYSDSQNMLTQGFVQPEPFLTTTIIESSSFQAKIFPNPVSDYLFVEFDKFYGEELIIEIYDILGKKLLINQTNRSTPSASKLELNFQNLSSGFYFLRMTSSKNKIVNTFKISKI